MILALPGVSGKYAEDLTFSSKEQVDCAEGDETHEVGEQFVVARGDAAEVFEFIEKPLDQIAFFVEVPIAGMRSAAITSRRNDRHGAGIEDGVVEVLGIVGPVGDDGATGGALDQCRAEQYLATMAGTCDDTDRIAEAIGRRMQLGA